MEGWRLAAGSVRLGQVVALNAAIYLLYGASLVYEPLYVKNVLGRPTSTFAQLQSTFGVALLLCEFLVLRHADRLANVSVLAKAVVASGAFAALYLGALSVRVAFVAVVAWGSAAACVGAPSSTLLLRLSPPEAHGRIMALDRTVDGFTKLVAMLVAGTAAELLGVRGAAVAMAGLTSAVGLTVWLRVRRGATGNEGTSRSSAALGPEAAAR